MTSLPLMTFGPVQPPPAMQAVAFVNDQVNVNGCPTKTRGGSAAGGVGPPCPNRYFEQGGCFHKSPPTLECGSSAGEWM
jgi:hypothetical protein